ncbi:hypothetical protein HMN09_00158000 [Mycena chlorophos]|uniref:Uncharacterized protein n=1 Tax=Mycena chlorophos TaxID=658473 RepID=A0A8H6TQ02_MYCCL|nr:hypothetical protein HMN09_00158000 [Mycena chlorophos]
MELDPLLQGFFHWIAGAKQHMPVQLPLSLVPHMLTMPENEVLPAWQQCAMYGTSSWARAIHLLNCPHALKYRYLAHEWTGANNAKRAAREQEMAVARAAEAANSLAAGADTEMVAVSPFPAPPSPLEFPPPTAPSHLLDSHPFDIDNEWVTHEWWPKPSPGCDTDRSTWIIHSILTRAIVRPFGRLRALAASDVLPSAGGVLEAVPIREDQVAWLGGIQPRVADFAVSWSAS